MRHSDCDDGTAINDPAVASDWKKIGKIGKIASDKNTQWPDVSNRAVTDFRRSDKL